MTPPDEVVQEFETELDSYIEEWVAGIDAHVETIEDDPSLFTPDDID